MDTIFVSHSPCRDGNTASYVAWLKHGEGAKYLRESHGQYQTTRKLIKDRSIAEKTVIFLDICPPRELLIDLHSKAKSVYVWDHHKTAEEDCGDLPYVYIDNSKSGASLTWSMLFPEEPMPNLIRAVEAGDIWEWDRYEHARMICLYLETQKFSLGNWARIHTLLETESGLQKVLQE